MDSKIQIITYPPINNEYGERIKISYFDHHDSVDSYEYNIIDLNNPKIWRYDNFAHEFIDKDNLQTLKKGIENNNQNNYFIIILPKNLKSHIYRNGMKQNEYWIKNESNLVQEFIKDYFKVYIRLVYGNNRTKIQNYNIEAGFYMQTDYEHYKILTRNTDNKITSIKQENIILTTLQLTNRMEVITFINSTLLKKEINIPDWFEKIEMFDDSKQKEIIKSKSSQINKLESEIAIANEKLEKNNEYKSILYTQGKPLEKTVLQMLSEILNYDLSQFIDEKREDFLVKLEEVTFVGEIKGVNSNLKNKHLAQLNIHLEKRRDKVKGEHLKPLMIINRFKEYPPEKRKPIDEEQIKFAIEKYEHTLIITVETLLELYWQFIEGTITPNDIIKKFKENEGLFEL